MWIAFECCVPCAFQVSTLNCLVQITSVIVLVTVEYSKAQAMADLFGIRQRYKALAFSYYNLGISIESGTGSTAVLIGTVCPCHKFLCGTATPCQISGHLANECRLGRSLTGPVRSDHLPVRSDPVLGPRHASISVFGPCLLYTSDAADE